MVASEGPLGFVVVVVVVVVVNSSIAAHPHVKAFITHGGYNSVTEAVYLGVPLIVMPLFDDQYQNSVRIERRGWCNRQMPTTYISLRRGTLFCGLTSDRTGSDAGKGRCH